MLKKLRWKFILVITVLLAGMLAAALTVQTVFTARQYQEETERVLRTVLDRGEAALDPLRSFAGGGFAQDEELRTGIPAFYAVSDGRGRVGLALGFNASLDEETVVRAVEGALASGNGSGKLEELGLRFLIRFRGSRLELGFAGLEWEREAVRRQVITAALILAAALPGFFAVSVLLSRWLVRPVEESWRRQQQFVADASHELKTPLTVLLADTEILLSHPGDTIERQRRWVEHLREEELRMKGLVEDLLFLARGDAGDRKRPQERMDLSQVCGECVMSFEPVAFEAGLTLESSVAPGVGATGDGEELRRLCAILLDNACKYCQPGGAVTVTLERREGAVLTVHNTGEPIPAEDQARLFERFYRADAARTREKGGYGLGLSIAAAITQRHGGKIAVHSTAEEGTAFTVMLPPEKRG